MILSAASTLADDLPMSCTTTDGLVVLDDGTLLRGIKLHAAITPLRMGDEEMERINHQLQEIAALLPDRQRIQHITTARPFDWPAEINTIETANDQVYDALVADGLHDRAESLRRLAMLGGEAVIQQSHRQSAMTLEHYVIVPLIPTRGVNGNHQIAVDKYAENVADLEDRYLQISAQLETLQLDPQKLNGIEMLNVLYRVLNPGTEPPVELGELLVDAPFTDVDDATEHMHALRAALCQTDIDRSDGRTYLEAGGHVIQSRALSSTPNGTWLGWLMHLSQAPYPFTLSVTWEAGNPLKERAKAKTRYRRIFGLARGKEMKLRPIDFEERQREDEARDLTAELAGSAGAGVYQVSVNLTVSSPPDPLFDPESEEEADDDVTDRAQQLGRYMESLEQTLLNRTDSRLHLPWYESTAAWQATWPLALLPLGIKRRYVTENVADTFPGVSAHCGSPTGIPLGWEQPGRTLARLDPWDPWHDNHVMLVTAKSGKGKTMATNLILGRMLAWGATAAIIDRAGHYEPLAKLVPGAAALNLGTQSDAQITHNPDPWKLPPHLRPAAINPWDVEDPRHLPSKKLQYLIALHTFFLGRPTSDGSLDLDPSQESLLSLAIRQVYQRCAVSGEQPREALLQNVLRVEAEREHEDGNHETGSLYRRLADGLYDYVGDGSRAYLADWPTSIPEDSPLVIFDTRNVSDSDIGAVMFSITQHLAEQRDRAIAYEHRGPWAGRRILISDESYKIFESRAAGRYFNELARRSRHYRLFFIAISQSITDFTQSAEGAALVSQSTIQLHLQQKPEQARHIREENDLTALEEKTIADLKTVKGQYSQAYFINGLRGSGLIHLQAGAGEYWYATSETVHDQPLRAKVLAEHNGDMWAALSDLTENYAPLTA